MAVTLAASRRSRTGINRGGVPGCGPAVAPPRRGTEAGWPRHLARPAGRRSRRSRSGRRARRRDRRGTPPPTDRHADVLAPSTRTVPPSLIVKWSTTSVGAVESENPGSGFLARNPPQRRVDGAKSVGGPTPRDGSAWIRACRVPGNRRPPPTGSGDQSLDPHLSPTAGSGLPEEPVGGRIRPMHPEAGACGMSSLSGASRPMAQRPGRRLRAPPPVVACVCSVGFGLTRAQGPRRQGRVRGGPWAARAGLLRPGRIPFAGLCGHRSPGAPGPYRLENAPRGTASMRSRGFDHGGWHRGRRRRRCERRDAEAAASAGGVLTSRGCQFPHPPGAADLIPARPVPPCPPPTSIRSDSCSGASRRARSCNGDVGAWACPGSFLLVK